MSTLQSDLHPEHMEGAEPSASPQPAPSGSRAPMKADTTRKGRMGSVARTLERYLVPSFVASGWIYARDGALVSLSSKVQLSALIRFGKDTLIKPYTIVQTAGGRVVLGKECRISSFNLVAAGAADVILGDHVRTGPHVTILAATREWRRRDTPIVDQGYRDQGIVIGNDVFIGANSVILDGCRIGDGAVISAGSVVSGTVEPFSVVAGERAKKRGRRR